MSYTIWQIQGRLDDYLGRYEFVEGKSAKFWECLKDGDNPGQYATRWGAIKLTKTRHNTKSNMSRGEAASKIVEKLNKGYQLVANTPNDVMNLRFAQEEAVALTKAVESLPQVQTAIPEATDAPAPTRRRL